MSSVVYGAIKHLLHGQAHIILHLLQVNALYVELFANDHFENEVTEAEDIDVFRGLQCNKTFIAWTGICI